MRITSFTSISLVYGYCIHKVTDDVPHTLSQMLEGARVLVKCVAVQNVAGTYGAILCPWVLGMQNKQHQHFVFKSRTDSTQRAYWAGLLKFPKCNVTHRCNVPRTRVTLILMPVAMPT